MHKIKAILFIFLLLFASPVYARSNFQYSRLIQTDNVIGYKSVILDQDVYAHSNHLHDLRVINDSDEEVPYFITSISDASTETERESFILSEEAQYSSYLEGSDSIIKIEINKPHVFYLELKTNDAFERNYGLYSINGTTKRYLSDGTFSNRPLDSTFPIQKGITWTDTNQADHLELVIHNRDAKPIAIKSINVKYYLTKLVFKDLGNSHYWLSYGNDLLRSPIYDEMNHKAIIKTEVITQSMLGEEVSSPPKTAPLKTPSNQKLLFNITFSGIFVLFLIIGLRLIRKRNF